MMFTLVRFRFTQSEGGTTLEQQITAAAPKPRSRVPGASAKPVAVSVNATCDMGGWGRTRCYELIREGKLKSVVVGRKRLVLVESIEALLTPENAAAA
jgi:hypothetical protein